MRPQGAPSTAWPKGAPVAVDDKVGYGRPPKKHQFKKGKSGNPKGRPKGSPNFLTAIERELNERVFVTEEGRRKSISKMEASAKQLVNRAATGDLRALAQLLALKELLEGKPANQAAAMSSEDEKVLEDVARRIRNSKPKDQGGQ